MTRDSDLLPAHLPPIESVWIARDGRRLRVDEWVRMNKGPKTEYGAKLTVLNPSQGCRQSSVMSISNFGPGRFLTREDAPQTDTGKAEEIVPVLTEPQRRAVFPGPGNPEYARGPLLTMKSLERLGVVIHVSQQYGSNGTGRSATLTSVGHEVRRLLAKTASEASGA